MLKSPKPFLIAEVAQAHNGSFDKAIAYIDALSTTGVHAIKFQTHIAQAESSIYEPFRIQMQTEDKTRYDYWKRMEFSIEEWKKLKEHAEKNGLEFMSSPFSNAAVDLLEKIGVNRYKVGSGEVTNFLLLQKIAQTKKPLILSSGMSCYTELDKTVDFLKSLSVEFSLLQCTTSYPTQPENYGLNVIAELKKRYGVQVGFSDHSARIETGISAVALGAELLEFHVKLDENKSNPDASSSLTIDETKHLVNAVQSVSIALKTPVDKNDVSSFESVKSIFEKSLAVNKSLKAGHKLQFEDLEAKKPKGYGIDASRFQEVLGKTLLIDKHPWEFLTTDDVQP